jgi:cysteinyl-tRNA synthetase
MTEITLYNTRSRRKEPFRPLDPSNVRMYVCGPTVYDRAHIGNARPVVVFDVLFRLLRHVYGEDHVTYVRNITDVDDKILARAAESGRPIREITEQTIGWYREDMRALGALDPSREPRATEFIREMVAMIATLVANGHAYAAEGHVLFAVARDPDYGKLARRSLDEMRAGARVEVAPYKRDPMDFVLWKPSDADQPGWDSPWGRGRPGWHIECSAMAYELLGASFDIHGGGIDLVFPHHENELAQSRCAHPEGSFASVWMHNGFLNVDGEKMSKSLGNFFTVRDLLHRGVPGEVMRVVLLGSHYRQPMDFSEARVEEASVRLTLWEKLLREMPPVAHRLPPSAAVVEALADDLNTPLAITNLIDIASTIRGGGAAARDVAAHFRAALDLLGIRPVGFRAEAIRRLTARGIDPTARVEGLLTQRRLAREGRDFARADAIRDQLIAAGIKVMDRPGNETEWELGPDFDAAKLAEFES